MLQLSETESPSFSPSTVIAVDEGSKYEMHSLTLQ